jgi:hypothetical protein
MAHVSVFRVDYGGGEAELIDQVVGKEDGVDAGRVIR